MGREISSRPEDQDRGLFRQRLHQQLDLLQEITEQPGFGDGPLSIGAELETNIIDTRGKASYTNQQLLEQSQDPRLSLELNRYNLEFNLTPQLSQGNPFTNLAAEIKSAIRDVNECARQHNTELVSIGILPTLDKDDLNNQVLSNMQRYKLFSAKLLKKRGEPFQLNIDGEDPLNITTESIAFEGAGTSFQLHLRVPTQQFSNIYNAVQLITAPVLAYSANSPTLLGHRLWDETRIALFKQSIDTRRGHKEWRFPPRVVYGQEWNRHGIWELFASNVHLYEPIFAQIYDTPDTSGENTAKLEELQLHQGTVWSWNRGIYDHHENGHLRIELRTLPAGPTISDMVANAAVMAGLAFGLAENIEQYLVKLPFKYAEYNFYRAAKHGMNARLIWPKSDGFGLKECSPNDILSQLWPSAKDGLKKLGVDDFEATRWLTIFEKRWQAQTSGAHWQRMQLARNVETLPQHQALQAMLKTYLNYQHQDIPVSEWTVTAP
ncbi:glutamate--cysteine ligase [Thalassotalea mangrovi]|uniref:Glutamate--cysteine ligase n=1 Tax=Thalassotalea mangrovi TaxID=2572245 RepID=A0A4U1B9K0_9GAMM|nr:glutamate--cysteine ligase [Thalassotalea mangrovi]TKB47450.1 glutamate--cysteine ligase [Thalassotalea mangrovi]